jgi:hypothetical protein
LEAAGAAVGYTLGRLAARLAAVERQRAAIAAELARIASSMAGAATRRGATARPAGQRKGGRPKGFKMTEASKRKLRAAWKRRKAAAAQGR